MSNATADAPSKIVTRPEIPKLRGGQYTAIQDEDGTWCLKRVEIFSEIPAGERGNEEALDEKWLKATVANMREKYFADKQYVAPVHVNHHDRPTEQAGYMVPVEVGPYKFANGKTLATIFVDIFKMPGNVYAEIKGGRLCFRSVEIPRRGYADREIGSLALMADEPPHFQYAMTTVGHEIKRAEQAPEAFAADKPFMFRAEPAKGGKFMADEEKDKKKDAPPQDKDGEKKPEGDGTPFQKEGEAGADGDAPVGPAPGAEAGEVLKAVTQMFTELKALMVGMLAMHSGQATPGNATPVQMKAEIEKVIEKIDSFKNPAAAAASKTEELAMPDPKMDAEMAAVKTGLAELQKARVADRLRADAFRSLEGFVLIDATKKYIDKYADANDEKGMKEFVDFFKSSGAGQPLPPHYTPGVGVANVVDLPKEVADGMVAMSADERERETVMFRAWESDSKMFGPRRNFAAFKKAEELRTQALRIEQGGRGGLPLFTGRA